MTTAQHRPRYRLPDRPEREPDDMTSFKQLANTSIIEPLRHHLGRRETTLITGEQYLCDCSVKFCWVVSLCPSHISSKAKAKRRHPPQTPQ